MLKIKQLILSNAPLKVVSLFMGYTFWYIFGHAQTITTELTVPLCFYGATDKMTISAPDTVHIALNGKRAIMHTLDLNNLAIHVDARALVNGTQPIEISQQSLFLPESIKLVHYTPAQICVTLAQQVEETPAPLES